MGQTFSEEEKDPVFVPSVYLRGTIMSSYSRPSHTRTVRMSPHRSELAPYYLDIGYRGRQKFSTGELMDLGIPGSSLLQETSLGSTSSRGEDTVWASGPPITNHSYRWASEDYDPREILERSRRNRRPHAKPRNEEARVILPYVFQGRPPSGLQRPQAQRLPK